MKKLFILGAISAAALMLLAFIQSKYSATLPAAINPTTWPVLSSAFAYGHNTGNPGASGA